MVDWPLEHIGEIEVDGSWQRVPTRENPKVTITRGYSAQGSRTLPKPGECSITIDNRDGEHSPRNPNSSLFGKIGRGTPFRFRVGDLPDDPTPILTDTFDRTETDGWGNADTGQTWTIYDPFGALPPTSDFSVDDGTGRLELDTVNGARIIRNEDADLADLEATFTVATDEVSVSENTRHAVFAQFMTRVDAVEDNWYECSIGFRTDSGLPNGQGRRVSAQIGTVQGAVLQASTNQQTVPGLLYSPNVPLRVRVQAIGPELRLRVWADGEDEPSIWHSQLYDEALTTGEIACRGLVTSDGTSLPVTVHFGDLQIVEPVADTGVVRMRGEIPEWTPSRDLSGADLRVPVKPAGILRRLGTGQQLLQSTMRRHIPLVRPLAYWAMEEGRQGENQIADATADGNAGPLTVSGFDFAKDGDLIGSDPLPQLIGGDQNTDFMVSDTIPGEATGSWSVEMMFRISEQDFPAGSDEKTMLEFTTTGSGARRYVVSLLTVSSDPRMQLTILDGEGAELGSAQAGHGAAVTAGAPGLLDEWRQVRVNVSEDGSDLDWRFDWFNISGDNWGNGGTISSTSAGRVSKIGTFFGSDEATDNSLKGLGLGHLTVWGVRFHSGFFDNPFISAAGLRGQITRAWMRRLHVDANVPLEISGFGAERLGPYPTGAFLDLLGLAARTEMGLLTESRTAPGLAYRTRETLYNQDTALVLNWANGEIFKPFTATDGDKNVRNRITAKRREGSEATAELTEGRLSTKQAPDGIGLYDTSIETIVNEDDQLGDQAMWRLHVATVDEMRVTQLTLKMGNPRMRGLVDAVLTLDVGDRIKVENTPFEYSPDGFDLLILGYKETFAEGVWDITFTCEPYTPYVVAVTDDSDRAKADTDGSSLAVAADSATTSLAVLTQADSAIWVDDATYPDDFPIDIRIGGERITVSGIAPLGSDTFTRSETDTWGTATSGQDWTETSGAASDRSVDGAAGVITLQDTVDTVRLQRLTQAVGDCEVLVKLSVDQVATGASIIPGVLMRYTGVSDWYRARLHFSTGGNMFVAVTRGTTVVGSTPQLDLTYTAGEEFWLRVSLVGHTVRLRVWADGDVESSDWDHEVTITTDIIDTGEIGVTCSAFAGNTNTDPAVSYDDFQVVNPQTFTAARSVNGVVKAHAASAKVRLFTPAIVAL
ncbi:hypothetical protein [Streptomyces apocyni]|uniref:hypothetical protein n=1 Tax=Streptomyces apocyni TaxID=2654677 RepID=UPI0012EA3411|nr:hypothetical protein [Streptomyces apocyni]